MIKWGGWFPKMFIVLLLFKLYPKIQCFYKQEFKLFSFWKSISFLFAKNDPHLKEKAANS